MMIVMKEGATAEEVDAVVEQWSRSGAPPMSRAASS